MKEYKGSPALDAGLLAAAQAVEHYEISRYGTLIAWAEELGLEDAVWLLEDALGGRETLLMRAHARLPGAPSTSRPTHLMAQQRLAPGGALLFSAKVASC